MEFLVHITIDVPADLAVEALEALKREEARTASALAAGGTLSRLWREDAPGWTNWGLWSATDLSQLYDALRTLPLYPYMLVVAYPLKRHPNDPAASCSDA